jgi:hypothetical protein
MKLATDSPSQGNCLANGTSMSSEAIIYTKYSAIHRSTYTCLVAAVPTGRQPDVVLIEPASKGQRPCPMPSVYKAHL